MDTTEGIYVVPQKNSTKEIVVRSGETYTVTKDEDGHIFSVKGKLISIIAKASGYLILLKTREFMPSRCSSKCCYENTTINVKNASSLTWRHHPRLVFVPEFIRSSFVVAQTHRDHFISEPIRFASIGEALECKRFYDSDRSKNRLQKTLFDSETSVLFVEQHPYPFSDKHFIEEFVSEKSDRSYDKELLLSKLGNQKIELRLQKLIQDLK